MVAGDLVNTASRLQSRAPRRARSSSARRPSRRRTRRSPSSRPASRSSRARSPRCPRGGHPGRRRARGPRPDRPARGAVRRSRRRVPAAPGRVPRLRRASERPRLVSITGRAGRRQEPDRPGSSPSTSTVSWTTIYWHAGRSPAYGEGVTFWALGEMVRGRIGLVEGDDESATRAAVTAGVAALGRRRDRAPLDRARRSSCCSGSRAATGPPARSCLAPGGHSSSGSRRPDRSSSCSRTSTGPTPVCSTSSITCSTGARACRLTVVTLARPELLERRPGWGTGTPDVHRTRPRATLRRRDGRDPRGTRTGTPDRWPGDHHRPGRRHPAVRGRDDPDARG